MSDIKPVGDAAKGGRARANVLSDSARSEIARKAAKSRWARDSDLGPEPPEGGEVVVAHESGQPFSMFRGTLTIGAIDIEVHVLNTLQRVMIQREMVRLLSGGRESGNIQRYLNRNPKTAPESGFVLGPTIPFDIPGQSLGAIGYEATLLIEVCDRYLQARESKLLKTSQLKLAVAAEIIMRSCAKIGIIAMIDEATGFQKYREKNALALKFQAMIAEEMQDWARMFPEEFWLQLARLEGIRYSPRSRPIRWGKYVMMFVYDAIDPDIGKWLRENNPNPRYKQNHHQWLKKFGRDKVDEQLTKVITIMKLCRDMDDFRAKFAHVFHKAPLQLTFHDMFGDL